MSLIFNRKFQKPVRQYLRNNATRAERILWPRLKGKGLVGHKFRRQQGVGPFIVDFYCPECKLAIELDGPVHDTIEAKEYDRRRQEYIEQYGIRFLRFTNDEVYQSVEEVLKKIANQLTTPCPPPQ